MARAIDMAPEDAKAIVEAGSTIAVEQQVRLTVRGSVGSLEVRLFADDVETVDLYVRGAPKVIELVRAEFEQLTEEQ